MKQLLTKVWLLLCLMSTQLVFAQFNVSPVTAPYTPESLVEEVLLGEGVEIISVSVTGQNSQIGTFTGGNDLFGIESGVLLSTGFVSEATLPNTNDAETNVNGGPTIPEDPDLTQLKNVASNGLFDEVIYEIVLVPTSDKLEFRYVFASEEYPEFSCDQYSDFFGFFVSGPGISGPYTNGAENIALIPGSTDNVSIQNVHPGNSDPNYITCPSNTRGIYVDNSSSDLVFDGFIQVLTAEISVTPCEEYTLRIALTDEGDASRDSGVFLEAKSLSSSTFPIRSATPTRDGVLVEGCENGSFTIELREAQATDTDINIEVLTGADRAENGVDFANIPSNITIPAGELQRTIDIEPLLDNNTETQEEVAIVIQTNSCKFDTLRMFIRDPFLETPDLGSDTTLCSDGSISLNATINTPKETLDTASISAQNILIPNDGTVASLDVNMNSDIEYLAPYVIESVCIDIQHSNTENLNIFLQAPNGNLMVLSAQNDITYTSPGQICFSQSATDTLATQYDSSNPEGPYIPDGSFSSLWANTPSQVSGNWSLLVYNNGTNSPPILNGFGVVSGLEIIVSNDYSYNYIWTPTADLTFPVSDSSIAELAPVVSGTYNVSIIDSYGCSTTDSTTINVIDSLDAPTVICGNASQTEVTFIWNTLENATGYEISIDGGPFVAPNTNDTTHVVNGLTTGQSVDAQIRPIAPCGARIATHTCTALDCNFDLTELDRNDPSCAGASDGSITVSYNSPDAPINYTLDGNTNTTGVFTGLPAGTYTIMATDNNGCSDNITITLNDPMGMQTTTNIVTDISCTNPTGTVDVSVTNGAAPLTFSWSNGDATSSASDLGIGWHFVTITDDNGCQVVDSIELTGVNSITATFDNDTVCFGESGTLEVVNIFNATPPLSFNWSGSISTTGSANNLVPGSYSVTVSDQEGCEVVLTADVIENPEITATTSTTPDDCSTIAAGSASVSASGGTGTLSYLWNDPANQTTATASNLVTGSYTVTITDQQGCTMTSNAIVTNPAGVNISDFRAYDESCQGAEDGRAAITISNGTAPFNIIWDDPANSTSDSISNLLPGSYNVTVTDANNCVATQNIQINMGDSVEIELTPQDISCNGINDGQIATNPLSGMAPFSFSWSNGSTTANLTNLSAGSYSVTATDANGCQGVADTTISESLAITADLNDGIVCLNENNGTLFLENIQNAVAPLSYSWSDGSSADTAQGLSPGTYSVTLTDANGCTFTASADITENGGISTNMETRPDDCSPANAGLARVVVSGGTPGYTFQWNDPLNQTRDSATLLAAGSYSVTVTDAVGCSVTSTANVGSPPSFSIDSVSGMDLSCHGENNGQATVHTSGGTAPFLFFWNDAANSRTETVTGLAAGWYRVTVQDDNRCQDIDSILISEPEALTLDGTVTDLLCNGDSTATISVTANGGTGTLTYLWNDGETTASRNSLSAGMYSLSVQDENNCQISNNFTINEPAAITNNFSTIQNDCWYDRNGSIQVSTSGGTAPYQVIWSNGSTGNTINGLAGGTFEVTITDANDCVILDSTTLFHPDSIEMEVEVDSTTCFESQDGEIRLDISGGTGNLRTAIDVSAYGTTTTFDSLARGYYNLSIADDNGCILDSLIYVDAPPPILLDIGEDTTLTLGDSLIQEAIFENHQYPVDFAWQITDTTAGLSCFNCAQPIIKPLATSDLSLTLTDARGCTAIDVRNIMVDLLYTVDAPNVIYPELALRSNNQFFTIYGKPGVRVNYLEIYDRWGDKVFHNENFDVNAPFSGWNGFYQGEIMNPSVLVWVAEVLFPDGHVEIFKGDLTVIR